jgi:hypothetical protein
MILKKNFLQGYYEQKNTCTNKLGGKYPAPVFGGEKCIVYYKSTLFPKDSEN